MAEIHVGTSGWSYTHWRGIFYPEGCSGTKMLPFYAQYFRTVELNASFYRLPKAATFEGWREKSPEGFIFAVKASKFITHTKRLFDVKEPWDAFIASASLLRDKLGPILIQLPPCSDISPRIEGSHGDLPLRASRPTCSHISDISP